MQILSTRIKRKQNTPENIGVGFSSLSYKMFEARTEYRTTAVLFHNMNVINVNLLFFFSLFVTLKAGSHETWAFFKNTLCRKDYFELIYYF